MIVSFLTIILWWQ